MTNYELQALLKAASKDFRRANKGITAEISNDNKLKTKKNKFKVGRIRTAIPKSDLRQPLEQSPQVETHSTTQCSQRIRVLFSCFRTKLLDTDNKFGSVKYALDALRYAGLIKDDKESDIELVVNQYKCKKTEECTAIDLIYY
jgi:Holliday junction resolvase RusA-like endonuclease